MKEVQRIIRELGASEGFSTVVLTDASGLPMATSEDFEAAQALAAIVAEVLRVAQRAGERLDMTDLTEIMLLSQDAQRGVLYRQFQAGERHLVLAMVIQPNHAYWQATSQIIQQIQQLLWK
ncbi:MAG TPA: hypothetical protein ENN14_01580 [Chloroflexi bacterium]|nr:hypothetical protein [Chloroflexota bacterium]